jgi:hypothetical protein
MFRQLRQVGCFVEPLTTRTITTGLDHCQVFFPFCISRPLQVDCHLQSPTVLMSSLHNLSVTLAAVCLRAAHLGDTLRSFLYPSPTGSGGHKMAGLSTVASSDSEGGSDEFTIHAVGGSGSKDLSFFALAPELLLQLCLGAVNRGVKFWYCILPSDKCTVGAHACKVNHISFASYRMLFSCRLTTGTYIRM